MVDAMETLTLARQRPKLFFSTITFSDGQTIHLDSDAIVVLVGPNNAGKSAALRELQNSIAKSSGPRTVIPSISLQKIGTSETLKEWLALNAIRTVENNQVHFKGINYSIFDGHVMFFDQPDDRSPIASFFASRVGTEDRLTGSNAAGPVALHLSPPTHPIHLLLTDPELAQKLSRQFFKAFGQELVVFRAGGSSYPLLVGTNPPKSDGEDELSKIYVEKLLNSTEPLERQGDGMRSFATVLLHVLTAAHHSVQFLDEPEAFLHPPQAKLLGEFIARDRQSQSQLFIATHSPDVLEGLLAGGLAKVRVVRIQRDKSVNRVRELSKERTLSIANDPLMRYSGVFSGIFHKRVIVAESESDCLFYNSILNTEAVSGGHHPDVLFIHAGGKHRMCNLADTLRTLDVPVSVIADIDLLNERNTFEKLFSTLGGDWIDIEVHFEAIRTSVESMRKPLTAGQVKSQIQIELDLVKDTGDFPKSTEKEIKNIFKSLSPWYPIKRAGREAFGRGTPINHFDSLCQKCAAVNLWIVQVGELEGFCRTIEAKHGPDFTEKVLTQRNLETDPELETARSFMSQVWKSPKHGDGSA